MPAVPRRQTPGTQREASFSAMKTVPFARWINEKLAEPVRPLNLEHFQSRVQEIHDAVMVAITDDNRYWHNSKETFPYMSNIELSDWSRLTWWLMAFRRWHQSLPLDDQLRLSAEPVAV